MNPEMQNHMRQRLEELGLAIGLLTRFPLPVFTSSGTATIASSLWAYPIAGALVGAAAGVVFWLATIAGFSALACVLLAMGAALLAAGGFHEDGLSDFWDGIGGGTSREAKLIIMRDSRIGAYGVMALMLTLALQATFLVSLQHYAGTGTVIAALIAAESASRGAIAVPLFFLLPARRDGLGATMTGLTPGQLGMTVLIACGAALACLGTNGSIALIGGAVLGSGLVTVLAWRFIGGFTGDVLGAAAATARMAALAWLTLACTP
jgi:adenosylcobinamide-GDP ribazoletransferase